MIVTQNYTLAPNVRQLIAEAGGDGDGIRALIYVETHGSHYCAIGDSTVTTSNGVHLYGGEKIQLTIESGESLYAYATEAIDLRIILFGVFN